MNGTSECTGILEHIQSEANWEGFLLSYKKLEMEDQSCEKCCIPHPVLRELHFGLFFLFCAKHEFGLMGFYFLPHFFDFSTKSIPLPQGQSMCIQELNLLDNTTIERLYSYSKNHCIKQITIINQMLMFV